MARMWTQPESSARLTFLKGLTLKKIYILFTVILFKISINIYKNATFPSKSIGEGGNIVPVNISRVN